MTPDQEKLLSELEWLVEEHDVLSGVVENDRGHFQGSYDAMKRDQERARAVLELARRMVNN